MSLLDSLPSSGRSAKLSATPLDDGTLRHQLVALWDVLDSVGAVVLRADVEVLPTSALAALCQREARRIAALVEGIEAGWLPPSDQQPGRPASHRPIAPRPLR